jgi:hypothetical protein
LAWSFAALIPPAYLDCVVALGEAPANGPKRWIASGFLYGDKIPNSKTDYRVFLISNRHVFEGLPSIAFVRFNPRGQAPAKEYALQLKDSQGKNLWFCDPDKMIDVGVLPINANQLKADGIEFSFFLSDQNLADRAKAETLGITEGDGVFILGFPMELIGGERNFVVVRGGTIARIRDYLSEGKNEFLVDALVFPGNSGGPLVNRPEAVSISGTPAVEAAYLIGMVKGYLPYDDVAVSAQTGKPRVIFEENSGLVEVVPADLIEKVIREAVSASP